ncbi:M48 family metalloprotease [Saccharothrix australiensis]|uniref:Peptidase M48-like protein n=1 Tax=Saccharothrix australiensis TaxID=2072 RepID=A0A495W2T1_9PSEU|nr:M48 family metalloprotease [Saccharothrix australiensis]RKT55055.1 peptidase M48-like protein [Saccharothrix australiensis]
MTVEELRARHVELLRSRRVVDHLAAAPCAPDTTRRYHTWTRVAAEPLRTRLERLAEVRLRPAAYHAGHLHDLQRTLDALQPEVLHLARVAGLPVTTPVLAGVFPTGTLDGVCVPVPGRGVLVLVNSALPDLLAAVLKIMTGALPQYGAPPLLDPDQASYALAEAVNAYLYGNGAVGATRLPELSGRRTALVGLMLRRAIQFVIAHELGHVLAGHLVGSRRWTDTRTPVGALDARSVGWPREHEADRIAATVLLRSLDELNPRELDAHEPCLVGALLLVLFLHEVTDRLADELGLAVPFAGSHPPPVRRIQSLVEHLADRLRTPRALDLAADVATWLEDQLAGVREWFRMVDEVLI